MTADVSCGDVTVLYSIFTVLGNAANRLPWLLGGAPQHLGSSPYEIPRVWATPTRHVSLGRGNLAWHGGNVFHLPLAYRSCWPLSANIV